MGTAIVTGITTGFNGILTGLGNGVVSLFDALAVDSQGGLTNFMTVGLIMGGASLAIGVALWLIHKVGGRRKA
jgi:hypothetical protein